MAFTPYILPHIAAAVVCCVLVALLIWRGRPSAAARTLCALIGMICVWAVGNAFELASTSLSRMVFWANVEYIGILSIPVLWLRFSVQFTDKAARFPWHRMLLLLVVPAISLALVWTSDLHHLMRYDFHIDTSGAFRYVAKSYGRWFYLQMAYSYALILWATFQLVSALFRTRRVYRTQGLLLLVGVLMPWVVNAAYIFGLSPVPHMDLTPPVFALSALLVGYCLLHHQVLDIIPTARDKVMECISDGVLVLDDGGRVVDANAAAAAMLGCQPEQPLGRVEGRFDPAVREQLLAPSELRTEVVTDDGVWLDMRVTALRSGTELTGWVVVLRDVTARKQAEQERERLIVELQEAAGRIRTLHGLLPICANCKKVRDDSGYWRQVEEYVQSHLDVEFTHGICPECMAKLYPEYGGRPPSEPAGEGAASPSALH